MEQKISDRANLVTATFSSHPSVTTLQRLGPRASVVLPGAGWINTKRDRTAAIPVDSPIKAHFATFDDKNGNFTQDPGEDKRAWELAATAIKKDARVFVIADSDWIGDEAIKVPRERRAGAGRHPLADGRRSVLRPDVDRGGRQDHPHQKQDVVWFYSTIFLAPALVIGAGVMVTRKSRRKRREEKKRGGPPAPAPSSPSPTAANGGTP